MAKRLFHQNRLERLFDGIIIAMEAPLASAADNDDTVSAWLLEPEHFKHLARLLRAWSVSILSAGTPQVWGRLGPCAHETKLILHGFTRRTVELSLPIVGNLQNTQLLFYATT